jgi:hypothetical protein
LLFFEFAAACAAAPCAAAAPRPDAPGGGALCDAGGGGVLLDAPLALALAFGLVEAASRRRFAGLPDSSGDPFLPAAAAAAAAAAAKPSEAKEGISSRIIETQGSAKAPLSELKWRACSARSSLPRQSHVG